MPSNTAFLLSEMPATTMGQSVDSTVNSMSSFGQASGSTKLGFGGVSPRLLMSNVENLRSIGIDIDTNNPIYQTIRNLIIVNYSVLMLNSAYRMAVKAHAAREATLAAAETAAILGVPIIGWANAWRIPLALAGSAMVYGAFEVGEKFGSGDWSFSSGDISLPGDRRRMEGQLSSTGLAGK